MQSNDHMGSTRSTLDCLQAWTLESAISPNIRVTVFPGRAARTFETQEETRILERHQQRQCLSAFGLSVAIMLALDTCS